MKKSLVYVGAVVVAASLAGCCCPCDLLLGGLGNLPGAVVAREHAFAQGPEIEPQLASTVELATKH